MRHSLALLSLLGAFALSPIRYSSAQNAATIRAAQGSRLRGRVVDDNGAPIVGAQVVVVLHNSDRSYSVHSLDSGQEGVIQMETPGDIVRVVVQSVSATGYLRDKEESEAKEGNWNLSIQLQKSGTLKGRVVDAKGQAVKGAFVGTQKGEELPVVSDEKGEFTLVDVPVKDATLLASNGESLASFEVKNPDEAIEIKLPEVGASEDKAALAERLLDDAVVDGNWDHLWATLGPQRIERVLHNKNFDEKNSKWNVYVAELVRREPQTLLKREAELREATSPGDRTEFERLVMLAKAMSDDEGLRKEAYNWLLAQQKETRDLNPETVKWLLGLAQIGALYGENEEYRSLDYAAAVAERLGNKTIARDVKEWSAVAARVAPDAPKYLSQYWNDRIQMRFMAYAMRTWMGDNNFEAAKQGWEDLKLLAPQAEKTPVTPDIGAYEQPSELLSMTWMRYASFLGRSDAKAAIAMVKPLNGYEKGDVLLDIADEALQQNQPAVAREAVNSFFEQNNSLAYSVARAAGIAERIDAAFAAPIWGQAYKAAFPLWTSAPTPDTLPSIAPYARARAAKWSGESRIVIEREWAKRLAWIDVPSTIGWDTNGNAMVALVEAMAFVAPQRAVEMIEQLSEKGQLRAQARGRVAIALLSK